MKIEQIEENKSHTQSLNYPVQSPLRLGNYILFLQTILRFFNRQGTVHDHVKTTMRHPLTSVRMASTQTTRSNQCG